MRGGKAVNAAKKYLAVGNIFFGSGGGGVGRDSIFCGVSTTVDSLQIQFRFRLSQP